MKRPQPSCWSRRAPPSGTAVRLEILGQPRATREMIDLQAKVLEDGAVREVISWRQADGWLAWNFHGYHSMESGIRLLCEKGVDKCHPILSNALSALRRETSRLNRGIGNAGAVLDQLGFGGPLTIRAALFAGGGEGEPCLREQIALALSAFRAVLAVDRTDDLVDEYRGRQVYRQNIQWPSIYHLRLLALTRSWRTPRNRRMIVDSVKRLVKLSPLPSLNVLYKSRLIAPASFCMDDWNPVMSAMDDAHWMMWFHRMELLSLLGVVHLVPGLERQARALEEILEEGGGHFVRALAHDYFRKWGAYTGLMLERDWRDPRRRINDLTFRSLLILHHCKTLAS